MTILPTHTCFDDALEFLNAILKYEGVERLLGVRVVHGICLAPEGVQIGQPFAHAWCEEDGSCIQAGLVEGEKVYFGVDRAEFYAMLRPQDTTTYTPEEAVAQNFASGHFGPWEDRYRAIIKHGDRTVFEGESPCA